MFRDIMSESHTLDIIIRLGDAQRAHGAAKMGDVVLHSEHGGRTRQTRLHDLIYLGIVREVKEWKHPNNIKHIELTTLGWSIYIALKRIVKMSEVIL